MSPLFARLCLAGAMVIVGSSVVAGKMMVAEVPLYLASLLRFALAAALLLPLIRLREGGLPLLAPHTWLVLLGQSLLGSFLFTVLVLYGVQRTTAGAAGIITSTTPACVALIAWPLLGKRPGRREGWGVGLAVLGLLCIHLATTGSAQTGNAAPAPLSGNLLVLGAVACESLFLLLRKTVREPLTALGASTVVTLGGLAWFLVPGIVEGLRLDWATVPPAGWLLVGYYGAVVTVLAYLLWFVGVVRVDAAQAGAFTAVMPVAALLLSRLALGERLTLWHAVGCVAVLAGIALVSGVISGLRRGRPRRNKESDRSSA